MAALRLVETSGFLRHILADHPNHSPRATAYFARGDLVVRTSDTSIFETVFTLEKFYKVPRDQIRDQILPLLALPGIRLTAKRAYVQVFALYVTHRGLSFADCYHAALVRRLKLPALVSFDCGFDRITGLSREEP